MIRSKTKKSPKFIPWGIGVPASYNVKYDDPSKKTFVFLTRLLIKISDAVVFYSDYPKRKYADLGIDEKKMFVAHNTVSVSSPNNSIVEPIKRNSILFVGSLYKQKGVGVLLDAYEQALKSNPNIIPLFIVGGGSDYDNLSTYIFKNHLEKNVVLTGPIYEEDLLASYFSKARACISPNQAGLSVQKSLGYGVPFITRKDAITGGEIFDIINGENGILYEEDSNLSDIILDINSHPEKYSRMGTRGKRFYDENRTIDLMAQGVMDAISYALNH